MLMLFPMTLLLFFRGQGSTGPAPADVNSLDGKVGLRPLLDGHSGQRTYFDGRAEVKPQEGGNTGLKG